MEYKCECCNYTTNLKTNLTKHLNTPKHIKMINGIVDKKKDNITSFNSKLLVKIALLEKENKLLKDTNKGLLHINNEIELQYKKDIEHMNQRYEKCRYVTENRFPENHIIIGKTLYEFNKLIDECYTNTGIIVGADNNYKRNTQLL